MKMKKALLFSALIFTLSPFALAAQASCESVKEQIAQKIINNGVPESGFTLEIVANDHIEQAGGKIVGHCENNAKKIVYTRQGSQSQAHLTSK
ncbi:DUF1161 domain-containing protein [Photorhabdus bodei]|uniref:DUF1161 domain-containing protein n=2 Tax=Morganellaceae TaxID=1903414 RepID=A0A329WU58_9GAMM|nr:DUF1161 domain-containing protein [Photorhabdus bodei]RAX03618.1 hypothetical protein CKY03_01545 [Photorhabdus sp. S9-53]RAX03931.1 hypothetical protein CKY05_01545 [Photorhabdus sp. S10-54]RAX05968.1 hypothetical protein CKY04_01545 [Photorhabdus sp. S8-52]NDL02192.1 DUF1161 domain-containing protein [Photorhabdus bodei]